MKPNPFLLCLLGIFFFSACSTKVGTQRIDYESTRTLPPLEIPPDLSSLPPDTQTARTGDTSGSATYSRYEAEQRKSAGGPQQGDLLPEYNNIKLERAGSQRWLVVKATPEQLWPQVLDFLDKIGLGIAKKRPETGIVETNWAENRANVASGVQKFFSKLTGKGHGTGQRDMYRVRLERGQTPGTTEVYLTHRGVIEVVALPAGASDLSGRELEGTAVWQPRPADPELEAEMLRLFMVHLGTNLSDARAILEGQTPERAKLGRNAAGDPTLILTDSDERAWRRVGISLDRIGYVIESEDVTKRTYVVHDATAQWKQSKKKKHEPSEHRVALTPVDDGTTVEILDANGQPEGAKKSEHILSLLYDQLK